MNVRYEKIQIIPSKSFACDLYMEERQKVWTQWNQPRGPPVSATLPKADPVRPTLMERSLQSGTVLGAAEIKVSKMASIRSKVSGRQGKRTCTHNSNRLRGSSQRHGRCLVQQLGARDMTILFGTGRTLRRCTPRRN